MKSIVIYYSYGGNTRCVAEKIAAEIGADLAEIEIVKPYTGSYDHVVNQGQKEVNSGFQPKIRLVIHSRILRMPAKEQRFMLGSISVLMKMNSLLLMPKFKSGRNRL